MTESVLPTLSGMNKSLFNAGRFVAEHDGVFEFALDNVPDRLLSRAQASVPDIEATLSARTGCPLRIHLTNSAASVAASSSPSRGPVATRPAASGSAGATASSLATATADPNADDDDEYVDIDVDELEDASDTAVSGIDKVIQAFPGAVILEEES